MVQFPTTRRPDSQVLRIDSERYFLVEQEQAKQLGAKRAWNVDGGSRQLEVQAGQPFEIDASQFTDGYGVSFSSGAVAAYQTANAWDASAPGRLTTWPKLLQGEELTDTNYRGWLYYDRYFGMLYMVRGQYAVRYQVADNGDWPIASYHYFGDDIVCNNRPVLFDSKVYIPLTNASTGDLAPFQRFDLAGSFSTGVQTITIAGTPTSGTWTIEYDDGINTVTSAVLNFDATPAQVQAALTGMPGLQHVTLSSSGSAPNYTYTITMTGAQVNFNSGTTVTLTVTNSTTPGTITPAVVTPGHDNVWEIADDGMGATVVANSFCQWNKPAVGPVLVRGENAQVAVVALGADPLDPADWGALQYVGDPTWPITALCTLGRFLIVGKADGIFTFDEQALSVSELPGLYAVTDPTNFIGMVESNGWIIGPHTLGTVRWRPGAPWGVTGPETSGFLEGDYQDGWGRVTGLAQYGRYLYVTVTDNYSHVGSIASFNAPGNQRTPLVPQMYHQNENFFEDCCIIVAPWYPDGPNSGTGSDDNAVGTITWVNPSGIESDDGNFASATGIGQTHYLKLLDCGFTIPENATITGVKVTFKRFRAPEADLTAGDVEDAVVKLIVNGSITGDNKAASGQWPLANQPINYGSSVDLWGTSLNPGDVNDIDFGVAISANIAAGTAVAGFVSITVYYEGGARGDAPTYLAAVLLDRAQTTAYPVVYQLPRSGLTVANDPTVNKQLSDGGTFTSTRYYGPSRAIEKQYESVECYLELDPSNQSSGYVLTGGMYLQAAIDDGDWFTLIDIDGRDLVFDTGSYEFFFPNAFTRGHWIQFRVIVNEQGNFQSPLAVNVRDLKVRGFYIPKTSDGITAYIILREGGQHADGNVETRSIEQQKAALLALQTRDPEQGLIQIHDPVLNEDYFVTVSNVSIQEVRFTNEAASRYVAKMLMRRTVQSPQW